MQIIVLLDYIIKNTKKQKQWLNNLQLEKETSNCEVG
jgi:hypothetical protein